MDCFWALCAQKQSTSFHGRSDAMTLVKRYPNRKLYDTEAKQYITLDGIAGLIREGKEIVVIDHATGEDLTTLTLTQIIVEQEKKRGGLFPRSVLSGLIQAGEDRLIAIQRSFLQPGGFWRQFEEEVRQRIQTLVKRGELNEEEGRGLTDKLLNQNFEIEGDQQAGGDEIERILASFQIPTRNEVKRLNEQIDALNAKLEELGG
jgi:polyhydroxyalkanoate synthesis repressor PhaR